MEFVSLETTFRFLYKIDTLHTHTTKTKTIIIIPHFLYSFKVLTKLN